MTLSNIDVVSVILAAGIAGIGSGIGVAIGQAIYKAFFEERVTKFLDQKHKLEIINNLLKKTVETERKEAKNYKLNLDEVESRILEK